MSRRASNSLPGKSDNDVDDRRNPNDAKRSQHYVRGAARAHETAVDQRESGPCQRNKQNEDKTERCGGFGKRRSSRQPIILLEPDESGQRESVRSIRRPPPPGRMQRVLPMTAAAAGWRPQFPIPRATVETRQASSQSVPEIALYAMRENSLRTNEDNYAQSADKAEPQSSAS